MRAAAGNGWRIPAPPPAAFGVTDPDDAAWLAERLVPQPLRTVTEPSRLRGAVDRIPGTAIHCVPATYPFCEFGAAVGYRTQALDGPHDVTLTEMGEPRESDIFHPGWAVLGLRACFDPALRRLEGLFNLPSPRSRT